jgi:polysaccharide chain length determinant protein (PEP-CTERM system associated)
MIHEFDLYPEERKRLPMEDVVERFRSAISVQLESARRGTRGLEQPPAFHVRFTHTDPNVAARVTTRLGSLFVDENSRDRGALATATNEFLESQLAEARKRLEVQESRLEAFRRQHGQELPTQMQSNMQAFQSTQLQIQALVESVARDRDRKLMLERLYREAASEPVVVNRPAAGANESATETAVGGTAAQQLAEARETLASLQRRFKPEHPDVVRTKRLIADLESKVAAEGGQVDPSGATAGITQEESQRRERLRQMAAEIESLDRQTRFKESEEQRLRAVATEYQRRVEAVPGVESEWAALTRDYDTLQEAYRDLLNKSEAARAAVDLERRQIGEHFRVLDPAGVPVRPISPMRSRINAIGLLLGTFLGLGLAALLELRDRSFRSEQDVLDVLALPVLAVVPYVATARERVRQRQIILGVAGAAVLIAMVAGYAFLTMRLWRYLV